MRARILCYNGIQLCRDENRRLVMKHRETVTWVRVSMIPFIELRKRLIDLAIKHSL